MKKITALLTILLLSISGIYAQTTSQLSEQEKNDLTTRIKQKLDDFQDNLKIIVGGKERSTKQSAIATALKLFIGEGNRYQYVDNDNVKRWHKEVQMQTSSRRRGIQTQSMKSYLNALGIMQDYRYDRVTIDQADVVRVDKIQPTSDEGMYVATASICQHFCAYRDGKLVLNDYDVKTVKVYIEKTEYQTPNGKKVIWKAKLGDFKVTETWH